MHLLILPTLFAVLLGLSSVTDADARTEAKGHLARDEVSLDELAASPEYRLAHNAAVHHQILLRGKVDPSVTLELTCHFRLLDEVGLFKRGFGLLQPRFRTEGVAVAIASDGSYQLSFDTFLKGRLSSRYRLSWCTLSIKRGRSQAGINFFLHDTFTPFLREALKYPAIHQISSVVVGAPLENMLGHWAYLFGAEGYLLLPHGSVRLPAHDGTSRCTIDIRVSPTVSNFR